MKNALQTIQPIPEGSWYLDTNRFEHAQRVAKLFAEADIIPKHYRGSIANCVIAFNQATLMGIDPMLFMQKTYPVGGKIGIESQLAIALANKAKVFKDVIQYEISGTGDQMQCRAFAHTAATNMLCEEICTVQDAKDMGWWNRGGSPWPKQTKKMLRYRSAMNLIRYYCPEVLFGLDCVEEIRDSTRTIDITAEATEAKAPVSFNGMTGDETKIEAPKKSAPKKTKKSDAPPKAKTIPEACAELAAYMKNKSYTEIVDRVLDEQGMDNIIVDDAIAKGNEKACKKILDAIKAELDDKPAMP
jgi:Na+-translocating ferredoxin:NAD+ oxidoreductase RnfG subunit